MWSEALQSFFPAVQDGFTRAAAATAPAGGAKQAATGCESLPTTPVLSFPSVSQNWRPTL